MEHAKLVPVLQKDTNVFVANVQHSYHPSVAATRERIRVNASYKGNLVKKINICTLLIKDPVVSRWNHKFSF